MQEARDVTFAIISSAPAAAALLSTVCGELEKRTSRSIKPVVLRSYDKLVHRMKEGDVQIAWAPPLIAIELERETQAKIRLCARRAGKLDYMSAIFVKRESAITTLADLREKRFAWVAKESSAGYVIPRLKLQASGLDVEKLFSEETFRRTHEAVVRAVMATESDGGATFASFVDREESPTSAGWIEAGFKNDDVRIIATAGPIPSDVIAMSSSLPEETAKAISSALHDLGQPMKLLLNAESFDEPGETHFDDLRKLVDTAKHRAP